MSISGWLHEASPFHEGELAIQEKLGVRERIDRQGRRMIRDYLVDSHRQFFAQLSYVVVGGLDESGAVWVSMLTGQPGFLSALDDKTLRVTASILPGDPLRNTVKVGADIGFLGIELPTRRRNRINGVVSRLVGDDLDEGFEVQVRQSFGNCPQYIQARDMQVRDVELSAAQASDRSGRAGEMAGTVDDSVRELEVLSAEDSALILAADTFFIATAYQSEKAGLASGVDVSHRGGKPGFVKIDDQKVLTVPDFAGNNHFNTFGNILLNPRAGLLFLDFERGDLLHLSGRAEVIWDGPEVEAYEGAQRLFRFYVECGYRVNGRLGLRGSVPEFSPFLEGTGVWSS